MNKYIATFIALSVALSGCFAVFASVPLRWTVETSRTQSAKFDAYHGETLDIAASFQNYSKPLAVHGTASLYYQTNGMGDTWWTAPASVSSNTISATFSPALDPGSRVLNCFLGGTSSNYRAAFSLRFADSPGATPNILPLPTISYDARLNGTPTVNGTNLTEWVQARSQDDFDSLFSEWVRTNEISAAGRVTPQIATNIATSAASNVVTKSYVEGLGINTSVPVNVVDGNLSYNGTTFYLNNNPFKPGYNYLTASDISSSSGTVQSELDLIPYLTSSKADQGDLDALSGTVSAWQTYWDGDDVRVTVTNYYGSAGMPRLYIEEKMPTNDTHASPWFKVVWDEMTRWTNFLSGYASFTNNAVQNYADRAWGVYDSSTGAYSPDGLLQISQEQIMIASGLAYQKTVTTGGCAVWVLKATEPQTISGVSSNGFFRIEDGDGNALFEIVKGDKRTVGATASAIVANNGMTITYNVVAGERPTLKLATDLNGTWYNETECLSFATVSWSGSSGAYVATVTPVGVQAKIFAKATYVTGGETYIRNTAPISTAGGILCTDGVHKCRPVYSNGAITWEVVP